jgi:hypothetical protein
MKKYCFFTQLEVLSMELSEGTQESYGKHVRIACLLPESEIAEYEVDDSPHGRNIWPELK